MPAYKQGYYRPVSGGRGDKWWDVWSDQEDYAAGRPAEARCYGNRRDAQDAVVELQETGVVRNVKWWDRVDSLERRS